jgi:hypothetical protein
MRPFLLSGLLLLTTAAASFLGGCSAGDPSTSSSEDEVVAQEGSGEGEVCANGVFGTPQIDCAAGLVCTYPNGTAPQGPDGSSSAATGTCEKPKAGEGETCANGVFGTPQIDCALGLVCTYPNGTAPQGPDGSSSAATGTCERPGAGEGEMCGSGFFGTPQIDCAAGLVCTYPNGTAPQGPDGSSSGATGTCEKP